jgi:serine/threonine protein kinase
MKPSVPTAPYEPIPDKTQVRADRLIGQRIEQYEVVERIGEGGMGIVYRGENRATETQAAIKILRAEIADTDENAKRLFEEARAVSSIRCGGIVDVFGFGKLPDGRHYVVMEFLEGEPLDWLLRRELRLAPARAIPLLDEITAALEGAHAWAIVHGNLKPSNVFLARQKDGSTKVKLVDFGLAKQGMVSGRIAPDTHEVQVVGTPAYISPEQARAEPVTPATDLYALGAVAFPCSPGARCSPARTPARWWPSSCTRLPRWPRRCSPTSPSRSTSWSAICSRRTRTGGPRTRPKCARGWPR